MTQIDINFYILLFYIFLRNVLVFDKELAIIYESFNLKFSKKSTLVEKNPNGTQNFFFFFNFCLILHQNEYNFVQNYQILFFRSI